MTVTMLATHSRRKCSLLQRAGVGDEAAQRSLTAGRSWCEARWRPRRGGRRARGSRARWSRPRTPTTCRRSAWSALQGMPAATMPPGISAPGVTTEPAATSVPAPTVAPSSSVLPLPIRAFSPTSVQCTTQRVPDRRVRADRERLARPGVQHGVVLHVGALAHHDRADVGADDHAVPDARARLDRHVTDQGGRGGDEGVGVHDGALALELEQVHATTLIGWPARSDSRLPSSP